jgi:hypothetical protein
MNMKKMGNFWPALGFVKRFYDSLCFLLNPFLVIDPI